MKIFYYLSIALISQLMTLAASAIDPKSSQELKDGLIPGNGNAVLSSSETGEGLLDALLDFARDGIFALMAVIAIGMFLFIGARLLMARGNPEEFKKAMKSFVYAAIGIFIVAAAWAIVRFIAGINL